ncbi:related to exosome complex exonuclease [Lecanosticta acicola]|uniref:Ribosomal RNA-processing protein 43 n=1 Tax=Lecanosticta acicola TaxID=111012 RepID=A0AAI8YUL2_9PEZI|nr:related to exosome complex exonuclease [Lecanosticta acicola]
MANGSESAPGLSISQETFAKLTPGPFLRAHLKQKTPIRPNGRSPSEFRTPTINTGSLTHSNGSAVVRLGDTAVVCGVRGEVLLASDIPHPPGEDLDKKDLIEDIGLVVPNLELSTGCSPAHLPGSPPSTLAQSFSYRISSLLHDSHMVDVDSLRIRYTEPKAEDALPDEEPTVITKAYWTLYLDVLCLALDGNAFDAAWLAVTAALRDTKLPRAWWDPDQEGIICSPLASECHPLQLIGLPLAVTFAVFTTASPLKKQEEAETWVLADPDSFEEDLCNERITIVLQPASRGRPDVLKIEKSGGPYIGKDTIARCVEEAETRRMQFETALTNG